MWLEWVKKSSLALTKTYWNDLNTRNVIFHVLLFEKKYLERANALWFASGCFTICLPWQCQQKRERVCLCLLHDHLSSEALVYFYSSWTLFTSQDPNGIQRKNSSDSLYSNSSLNCLGGCKDDSWESFSGASDGPRLNFPFCSSSTSQWKLYHRNS